jgi:hypothetical protein
MYEDYLAQTPLMEWNTQKRIWQYLTDDHLFALWEPYLETWPSSGMTLNGKVYERQTPEPHTPGTGSLSSPNLPTPVASDWKGPNLSGSGSASSNGIATVAVTLLPTPTVGHIRNYDEEIEDYLKRKQKGIDGEYNGIPGISLGVAVRMEMLPTPLTTDYKQSNGKGNWNRKSPPLGTIVHSTNWGKYEPVVKRWEIITGRQAPPPTVLGGKTNTARLNSEFVEWVMGLPNGHLTGLGLTRKDELKACGNGVVPQQAALALSLLDPDPKL